ncbi:MAG: J domain-containing protein [Erysipelotrichales bacterium]|nr:J domain-containing protein [Erysipelotrichales bacterium]
MNPYQVLGLSPSASDDEVKKAYRNLSKKYHPDSNIGSPHQAEYTKKFKEVQTAYKTIMDDRKRGFTNQTYGSQQSTSSAGGYQYINDQQAYQEAAAYIQAQRYNEAMNILNMIRMKNSMWFYYAAIAEHGLGNNIRAQEYAKTAVDMEPMNMQYILLYNQLSGAQQQYHTTSQTYGNNMNMLSYCYSILMCNCMLNMCCC